MGRQRFRRSLTVRRYGASGYVDGLWTESSPSDTTESYSVQPASPDDMKLLPEGRQTDISYRLFGDQQLRGANGQTNADMVLIDGEWYEVMSEGRWQNGVISHYTALVTRMEDQPDV